MRESERIGERGFRREKERVQGRERFWSESEREKRRK